MPALTGGRHIHGGSRGICHLDGFRFDLSKHLFTSLAGPPTHYEQRETYLQVRGSSRYSAAEYKGVGNKRMTKNERDRRKDMPALTAGDIFMGGSRGICHLDGFRFDLSKHLFTSLAGPHIHYEQRETYLQVRGSSRYSAAEYKGVGNKRMTKNDRDRRKDMHINGYQIIGGLLDHRCTFRLCLVDGRSGRSYHYGTSGSSGNGGVSAGSVDCAYDDCPAPGAWRG